jgi:hypothetical protein
LGKSSRQGIRSRVLDDRSLEKVELRRERAVPVLRLITRQTGCGVEECAPVPRRELKDLLLPRLEPVPDVAAPESERDRSLGRVVEVLLMKLDQAVGVVPNGFIGEGRKQPVPVVFEVANDVVIEEIEQPPS